MEALDIYTLNTTPAGQAMLPPQAAVQVSGGGGGIGGGGGGGIGGIAGLSAAAAAARGAPAAMQQQAVRPKEEKEVLEHFAGVFALLNPQTFKVTWSHLRCYKINLILSKSNLTFKEVFTETIDYVVERIYKNYALQIMANSFLANNVTSPIFATILVEYLLERMHEMGSNMERSNLYLKLFKLVFGSVSLFAAENEQVLRNITSLRTP